MKRYVLPVVIAIFLTLFAPLAGAQHSTAPAPSDNAPPVIHHRNRSVDSTRIFYREAGPADAPVVLLLHGFPTSSHMFRNLIPLLADRYRVIAPDYPGYGQSASPDRSKYKYTFA